MHGSESFLENEIHNFLWDFETKTDYLISARLPYLVKSKNKGGGERTCRIVDFAVLADHRMKIKKNWKRDKYWDLAGELKLWNMKVTVIPIVVGALGTISKGLVKGLEDLKIRGQVENIQTRALLWFTRILSGVLVAWGDLLSPVKNYRLK